MKIQKAFKFKLRPSKTQEAALLKMVGSCRFIWNKLLAIQNARLKRGQRVMNWVEMANLLPLMKRMWPWLATDPYSQNLQAVCKKLAESFKQCFTKGSRQAGRRPRFKRRDQVSSARFPTALPIENNYIKIPKIGLMRFFKSREIEGKVKNVTVKKESTGWFVSIQTEREVTQPIRSSTREIGIDVGITRFATFSDGTFISPVNAFRSQQDRLAKAQRLLSRKVRFSSNWKKQKQIVSRIHSKIANIRKDFLHKVSTDIANSHGTVYIENLKIVNMSKSASGTVEEPGKNVAAKSGLNKGILDQGWGMFRSILECKLTWLGGRLVAVPPQYTSQRCPDCGHVAKENRTTQSKFECVQCGFTANADHVGAINVLRAGQALCGAEALALA